MHKLPFGSIRDSLETDRVTEPTRKVLLERFDAANERYEPRFFGARDYAALKALCAVLAPSQIVPSDFAAIEIDKRLDKNTGNGWRYNKLPPDGEAFRRCLRGFDEIARQNFGCDFQFLDAEKRNEILVLARNGEIRSKSWREFDFALFLEELLAEFAETFYAHPLAQEEIGYIGYADARGWRKIGLNEHDALEVQSPKSKAQSRKTQNPDENISIRRYSPNETVDAVIIGTGAGGAPILARLAQAGLKVVALEAGKDFDYRRFATDEREQSKLFWLDERLSAGKNALAKTRWLSERTIRAAASAVLLCILRLTRRARRKTIFGFFPSLASGAIGVSLTKI